jgi:TATA-binding protein-associated factor
LCVEQNRSKVSDKLIKNLSAFLCVGITETPEFHALQQLEDSILSLKREEDKKAPKDVANFEKTAHEAKIKSAGAQSALRELCGTFGSEIFEKIPRLKECMSINTSKAFTEGFPVDITLDSSTFGQSIVDEFTVLRTLIPFLHPKLIHELQNMYTHIIQALQCRFSVIRFAASRCFASMCKVDLTSGMRCLIESILPMVSDQHSVNRRQGATECIYRKLKVCRC